MIYLELQRQLELFQLDDMAQVSEDERLENIEKTLQITANTKWIILSPILCMKTNIYKRAICL